MIPPTSFNSIKSLWLDLFPSVRQQIVEEYLAVDGSIGAISQAARVTLPTVDKQVVLVCNHQVLESILVFLCPVLGAAVKLIISLIIEHLQIVDDRLISEV